MRKLIYGAFIVSAIAGGLHQAVANDQQRSELKEQLEVMNSIMRTKLQQELGKQYDRFRLGRGQLDYTYLAGQGIVYRLPTIARRVNLVHLSGAPIPPPPPVPIDMGEGDDADYNVEVITDMVEIDEFPDTQERVVQRVIESDGVEMEVMIKNGEITINGERVDEEASEQVQQQLEVSKRLTEQARAMNEQRRAMREQRRKIRDLKFALNNSNGEAQDKLKEELANAEQELAASQAKLAEAREQARAASEQIKQRVQVQVLEQKEQWQQRIEQLETVMAQTLCDYGNTLRALPQSEHISFVIEGAGDRAEGGIDKVYIFNQQEIMACKAGSGASDLLQGAVTYSF